MNNFAKFNNVALFKVSQSNRAYFTLIEDDFTSIFNPDICPLPRDISHPPPDICSPDICPPKHLPPPKKKKNNNNKQRLRFNNITSIVIRSI